jgi:hypothetical protein
MLVMALACSLSSCGIQLGKYTVSSEGFEPLEPGFGIIAIDRGSSIGASAPDVNLLCVIALCPGAKTHPPSNSSTTDSMFTSSRIYHWTTKSNKLVFAYRWNRSSDTVEIEGTHFNRTLGNTFIARCDGDGSWNVRQLSNISPMVDARGALREIQEKLPEDAYIASLSLRE